MTPRRVFDEERVFEPPRDQTATLPLFGDVPPSPRVEMLGAGQAARKDARERQTRKRIEDTYALIARVLEAYPDGLTRKEIAERAGLNVNTVNARCAEMRGFLPLGEDPMTWPWALYTEGRRGGESILHLARLKP